MSGFSTYTDNKLLNHIFTGVQYETPNKYIALFKSAAGLTDNDTSEWTEIAATVTDGDTETSTGYTRMQVADADWSSSDDSSVHNTEDVLFPLAQVDWGTVTHIALVDNSVIGTGNIIAWGTLRNPVTQELQPREILAGDQFIVRQNTFITSLLDFTTQVG